MSKKRRRSPGEGSISKRKDGRYQVSILLGWEQGPTGKPRMRRAFAYAHTHPAAVKELQRLQREQAQGTLATDNTPLGEYLETWLQEVHRPAVRTSTFITTASVLTRHVTPTLGDVPLSKVTPQAIQALLVSLQRSGYTRTVARVRQVLRQALKTAVKWGLMPRNPVDLVDTPRVTKKAIRVLTREEARALLDALSGDRLEPLYTVVLAIGLRRGEAIGLRWQDVDFERGLLHVRGQLSYYGDRKRGISGGYRWEPTKTGQGLRTLVLPKVAVAALRAHRERQLAEGRLSEYVFTRRDGQPLEPSVVNRHLRRLLQRAGLPPVTPHGLRHSCATLLREQGCGLEEISRLLGHASTQVTSVTYVHRWEGMGREPAERMDDLLGG